MDNTRGGLSGKWVNNERLTFEEILHDGSEIQRWPVERNGFHTGDDVTSYLQHKQRMLDAGFALLAKSQRSHGDDSRHLV